jgi:hypothetical protein
MKTDNALITGYDKDRALTKAHDYLVLETKKITDDEFLNLTRWADKNNLTFVTKPRNQKGTILFLDKTHHNMYGIYETGYVRRLYINTFIYASLAMYPINKRRESNSKNTYVPYESYSDMIEILKPYVEKRQEKWLK